jgi:hypothetical protein
MNRFEKKNTVLIKAFGQYLREHLGLMDELPDDTLLVMQVEGDEAFNAWSRRIAQPEPGQPIVYVKFTLKQQMAKVNTPADIEKLELQPVG